MNARAPLPGPVDTARPANVLNMDDRRPARFGLWLVLAGFGGFMLWAALAPLDKGVPLAGNVVVAGSRQVVQHPTGGVIEQLLVRDGDPVTAGQVLVRLDATQARAQYQSLRVQYLTALAMQERLMAERDGASGVVFSPALLKEL